jgi:predicted CoA-binding protein
MNNVWEHIDRIEQLTFPLDGAASVIKMVAEQLQDNDHSSALWLASDIVNQQAEAISNQVHVALIINKSMTDRITELEEKLAKLKPAPKKRGRPAKKGKK